MARYTSSFVTNVAVEEVPNLLIKVLESCEFGIVYQATDYLMAKEIPGQVAFSKLVSIEILIESTMAKQNEVPVTFVVKNDELPLNPNNHCQKRFLQLQTVLKESQQWRAIAAIPT